MKTKNIFITLNDVVRNIEDQFLKHYDIYLEELKKEYEYEVVSTNKSGTHQQQSYDLSNLPLEETSNTLNEEKFVIPYQEKNLTKIKLPSKSNLFWNHDGFSFEEVGDLENFIFFDHAFDIFGRSNELYKNAINDLNELMFSLISHNTELSEDEKEVLKTVNVSVLSLERDISKPATLFFLSKYKFLGGNIKFVHDYSQVWEIADLIITANPYIIQTKKKKKKVIKINTDYNVKLNANASYDSIGEMLKNEENLKIF